MTTKDAQSKSGYASKRVGALEIRLRNLEQQVHNCDPQIYERLNKLERSVIDIHNALVTRAEFELMGTTVRLQGLEIKDIKTKGEEALKEIRALTTKVGRCGRGQDGPDWGSDIATSGEGTPTYGA